MNSKDSLSTDVAQALGNRIRRLRTGRPKQQKQKELAEQADISVSFLSMIERGNRVPHIATLQALARVLDVPVRELFLSGDEKPTSLDPVLEPLAKFVAAHSLTKRDVDRLLTIARAMFKE